MLSKHLDKNNLHHAYLIEGAKEEIVPEIFEFLKSLKIKIENNPDVVQITLDSFKIDDARNLKIHSNQKGYSSTKKIFIISANSFLLEAQNTLLKLFEEPIVDTFFFIITPNASALLKTLISRFYFISTKSDVTMQLKDAEKFIKMPLKSRIDFIKELLEVEELEDEDGNEIASIESARSKALKFLDALEYSLHKKTPKTVSDTAIFHHFFKVREYLGMPGSSVKTLMESISILVPNF